MRIECVVFVRWYLKRDKTLKIEHIEILDVTYSKKYFYVTKSNIEIKITQQYFFFTRKKVIPLVYIYLLLSWLT